MQEKNWRELAARAAAEQDPKKLSPQSGDKDFNRVRVTVKTLRVNVFGKLTLRNNTLAVMHQVGKHAKFVAREIHFGAFEEHSAGTWI